MNLKELIIKNNFKFQKRFGQNFISDTNLLSSIVEKAEITSDDIVVEIGVGAATLTKQLCSIAKKVYGFEIDRNLKPIISENLSGLDNVEIIFKDFMKEQISELETLIGGEYSVVANLPYYITTPILMKLIEHSEKCKKIVVMVQEEVALRLCAKENTPDYGSITAAIDSVANAEIVSRVSRDMFFPKPNVDSAVVKIDIDKKKFSIVSREALRFAIRSAFSSRRKTLANNLINSLNITRQQAEEILVESGIELSSRGETLSTERFIKLADVLHSKNLA